jgi:hypothetical protein
MQFNVERVQWQALYKTVKNLINCMAQRLS